MTLMMQRMAAPHRACRAPSSNSGPVPLPHCCARSPGGPKLAPVRWQRHRSATTQSRFINIQLQASWGEGQSGSSSSSNGGEQYADSQPRWGGFLNSSGSAGGSGPGGGSGSSAGSSNSSSGSPVTRLLTAAVHHVRAPPLPGAAAPWLALPLLPVLLWCVGWVFTTGMFTLAQASMSAMCSVAAALYPSIPLRGASYEDIAVSLVKALQSGTDTPSTWTRPGMLLPAWFLRWLMGSLYGLASAGTGLAGSLMHSSHLLVVTGVSNALLYASCLLFMLPLGSGISSVASALQQRLQQMKAAATDQPGSSSGSSGSSSAAGSGGGYGGSSGYGGTTAASTSGGGFSLGRLSDTSALTLKLAGVLAWPCISAAAVLQPSLLLTAATATGPLGVSAPQVLLCCAMLALLLTAAAAAARFAWEVARRQADEGCVVDFGLQLGVLCAAAGALNVLQLGLCVAGRQLDMQQLGVPVLSTLILGRIVWSTWRLWRMEAYAPSVWLQVLTLTPGLGAASGAAGGGSGGSGGKGSGGGGSPRPYSR